MPTPKPDEKLKKEMLGLLKGPQTVKTLMSFLGCSRRTVYRYIDLLVAEGAEIEKTVGERPVLYGVADPRR